MGTTGGLGIWAAFTTSNLAGQGIVIVLIVLSLLAWTVMCFKYLELRSMRRGNFRTQQEFEARMATPGPMRPPSEKQAPYGRLLEALISLDAKAYPGPQGPQAQIREVENTLESCLGEQSLRYISYMSFLGTLTSGAPLLGLLGTAWGVMEAFGEVSHQQHVTLQVLAPGVSGALLTTVAGLLVALPCVFGYNALVAQVRRMTVELEAFASRLHSIFCQDK